MNTKRTPSAVSSGNKSVEFSQLITTILATLLISFCLPLVSFAGEEPEDAVSPADAASAEPAEEMRKLEEEYEAMIAEFEVQRVEAVQAAEEARIQAEIAREMARERSERHAESRHLSAEDRQRYEAEMAAAQAEMRDQMEEVRRQLSESHRALREASREVAKAHRDLAIEDRREIRTRVVNLGDRAVIGIVMGDESDEGIQIMGVSPDGPAERAGVRQGDHIVSFSGQDVRSSASDSSRTVIQEVMRDVEAGDDIVIEISRDGEQQELVVTAEIREPQSWQSYIRLVDPVVAPSAPGAPHAPRVHVERIVMPEIDHEALAAQVEKFQKDFKQYKHVFISPDGEDFQVQGDFNTEFEFEYGDLSEITANALNQANVLLGAHGLHGLKFASINPDLGEYFKTDRGVLVLTVKDDNPFELRAGDVLLSVNDTDVNSPTDLMRALRDIEPEDSFELNIKREKRNKSLNLVMPEQRWKVNEKTGWIQHHD